MVVITDTSGNVVQTYSYDSFGKIVNQTGSIENPYTYTGREWDAEAGLYYYRARYYDPTIGRFINGDPIGFAGGDVNFYVYVQNNPINRVDPFGYIAGIPDNLIGTGLVGAGFVFISTGNPVVGIPLIIVGGYFLVDSPITKYFIQKPLEETAKDLAEKYFEDLDEFDKYNEKPKECK